MREFVIVQEFHGIDQLIRDVSHMIHRVWFVIVVLEEVEHAEAEDLKGYASVTVEVKVV